jgi:hypothetical protein
MNEVEDGEMWVVDRVEGEVAVLIEDEEGVVVEMAASLLGELAIEGAVLLVPLGTVGEPRWADAVRDVAEEEARREEGEGALKELRDRDPGGDIAL